MSGPRCWTASRLRRCSSLGYRLVIILEWLSFPSYAVSRMSVHATTPIFFERGIYWKDAACTQPFTDQQAAKVLWRDVRATRRESVRGIAYRKLFPPPAGMPNPYPTWPVAWFEIRGAYGTLRGVFLVAGVLALIPFELLLIPFLIPFGWIWRQLAKLNPYLRALLVTVVLGGVALYFWNWPGLLVVCLFVWLFTLIRQNQQRRSSTL